MEKMVATATKSHAVEDSLTPESTMVLDEARSCLLNV